jgi:hypothetical protein
LNFGESGYEVVDIELIINDLSNDFPQEFSANLITLDEEFSFNFLKSNNNLKSNSFLDNLIYTEKSGTIQKFKSIYDNNSKEVKFSFIRNMK